MRNPVTRFTQLTQIAENLVCLPVDDEAGDKEYHSGDKSRVSKPFIGVATRETKDIATIEIGIHHVEQKSKDNNDEWHPMLLLRRLKG